MTSPWSNQRVDLVIIETTPGVSGLFVYSGAPASGNLIGSIAAAAGTDAFGNAYLAGLTSYRTTAPFFASQVINGSLVFYHAASLAGPWSSSGVVGTDSSSDLLLAPAGAGIVEAVSAFEATGLITGLAGATISGLLLTALAGASVTGGTTTDTLAVVAAQANGQAATISNSVAGGARALLALTTAGLGDLALNFEVSGDTNARFAVDTTAGGLARLRMGSGSASPDTTLLRAAAGQWAADGIAFNNAGAAETWQTVGGTGAAFAGTWANAASPGVALQYRRNAAPYKTVTWAGRVTNTVAQAAGSAITAAVPAAYRTANTHDIVGYNITAGAAVRISIGLSGVLTCQNAIAANDVVTIPDTELALDI